MQYLRVFMTRFSVITLTMLALYSFAYAGNPKDELTNNSLSGKITDKNNHTALPGATIYLPDLKVGASADANGNYRIKNLPKGKFLVELHYIGYAAYTEVINIEGATNHDFELSETLIEKNEVVVTGVNMATSAKSNPVPISIIRKDDLDQHISTNIIDAISKVPGVSQLSTGPAISKPFIRGLGYNRVVVVSDAVRQEGQQWGDEHGIEIDDYNVSRIEVLKGPASLMYGSDALAGVVNIITPAPLPVGRIKGNLEANYMSNNGTMAYHADIAGNQSGFSWSAYITQKQAHDYKNKYDDYVFNSRYNNTNYGASIGINKKWGYSHLTFTSFNQNLGLVEGERDSVGGFIKLINNGGVAEETSATDSDNKSYSMNVPKQKIAHQKIVWDNSLYLANGGRLALTLGYQLNQRKEYGDVLAPNDPELFLDLKTFNYGLRYFLPEMNGWQTTVGVNGMQQTNANKGEEYLIPAYDLFDIGGFAVTRKSFGKLTLTGGARFDNRSLNSKALFLDGDGKPAANGEERFTAFNKNFNNVSASVGISYAASDRVTLKANAARGFRAPNIAELSANGVHEGTIKYEYGNTDLKPEVSTQADIGVDFNTEHVSLTANIFYNHINNFIYSRKLFNQAGSDSIPVDNNEEGYAAFKYQQTTANLYGGELMLDIHPHPIDWLHFENTVSYVRGIAANGTDSTKYLPNIPAGRWLSELKGKFRKIGSGVLQNAYVGVQMDMNFAQHNIFSAYETETPTSAFTLLNAGFGSDFVNRKNRTLFSLHFAVNNITDVAYQSNLSRLKYADVNPLTGRAGVFNMGRNFSVKLAIPIDFK
ncbi:iron complex outermembrane recepter protein [Chitinophaga jiangningensis]|uniref:Iron complex outermembrane recepter protein n=1 Tax=Chitinophaga jiangningensis TaxID=1419482 RepID=A0A1M6WES1_9BACT|nr:TonB-dependent receptor [Chitinophaga jiangningensis]SHK92191.1 iron complex outermembrane recepter protein [Chitinophaga jiangningensis]